jgi:hypothetical protein
LTKVTKTAEVLRGKLTTKSKSIFLKRSDRSLFVNTVLLMLGLYLSLIVFTVIAGMLGSISAEIGKPLPKIIYKDRTYDLVREYSNRIIISENNAQNGSKTFKTVYSAGIGSYEITE